MSDQNKKKSRGLGDTVKKAITVTTFGLVKQKPGCGCEGRQAWLNKKFPYKWYKDAMKKVKSGDTNRGISQNVSGESENIKTTFHQVTEELLTPEQKNLRDQLLAQRLRRANTPIANPDNKENQPEKKCLPCEAARIERERLAALEKNQPDTTES
tara:strand:+ start:85 stop:549 length:465 start_codon:yes stop_codon:yes gene_type:complete